MDYIIKVVPMEIANKCREDKEEQERVEREKRYQEYLTRISDMIATGLTNGCAWGRAICYRSKNPEIFFDEVLCMKAAQAVADAYKSEGYKVLFSEYSYHYKKICEVLVHTA